MIVLIITGLLLFFNNTLNTIFPNLTTPFDSIASNVQSFFSYVSTFFSYLITLATSVMDFVCELFAIPPDLFNACCFYLLLKLSVPVIAAAIKLILRWYQSLMPTK